MISLLKKIGQFLRLLTSSERRGIGLVFGGLLLTGIFEVAGVGSVVPFLAVVGKPSLIFSNSWIKGIYDSLGFQRAEDFIVALGLSVIGFLLLANVVKAAVYWFTVRLTKLRMVSLTLRLFRHFLLQPYYFFLDKNSADMFKSLFEDLPLVLDSVLDPLLDLVSKLVIVIGLITLLLVTDPIVALSIAAVLGSLYLIMFLVVRKSIVRRGHLSNELGHKRYHTVIEAINGVKDVKFAGTEEDYLETYRQVSRRQFLNDAAGDILGTFPRYLLEVIAFGSVILVVLSYIVAGRDIADVLPLLGLYTFAGYRLLPYLQQIYTDIVKMRYAAVRVDRVMEAFASGETTQSAETYPAIPLDLSEVIRVKNLTFRYPRSEKAVLNGLNLEIPVKSTVGLVGFSGAGKSTFVDLLLGLLDLPPNSVFLDELPLSQAIMPSWKKKIGYVPQTIYLSDSSLASNIAFGVPIDRIDRERVESAAKMANLHDFVQNELPEGYDTQTGERGLRLSGGQRQRVGIARALYRDPEVLILDEATSALDGVTEAAIMDGIHKLGHSMTILIIAHRLTTLKECDRIFMLEEGKVVETGTYASLIESNAQFRKMAGKGKKA